MERLMFSELCQSGYSEAQHVTHTGAVESQQDK